MMDDSSVVSRATQFFELMSATTAPDDLAFHSYCDTGVAGLEELCAHASRCARGGDRAMASLTIVPGDGGTFSIDGTHATATLSSERGGSMRLLILCLLALVLVVVIACRRG